MVTMTTTDALDAPASAAGRSRPLRILLNVETLEPNGGISWSALQVAEGLAARGHELHVLFRFDGELRRDWEAIAASVSPVPGGFTVEARAPWRGLATLPASVRAAARVDPDVVWCNRSEQLLWAGLVRATTGARVVCHLRHHPFARRAVRPLRRVADSYLAVSEFVRAEWIAAGLPAERVHVVHNGVDADRYPFGGSVERTAARSALGIAQDAFVVLYAGRPEAEKGVELLLAAWDRMVVDRPATLALVGPGGPARWPSAARTVDGHRREVRALPQTRDVVPLLHAADALALPSIWQEPFGRVLIEAMATGRPTIATRVGGVPEILTGPLASLLCEPGDVPALTRLLERTAQWRRDSPDLGTYCRRHVVQHFGLARVVDAVEASLADASAATSRRRAPGRVAAGSDP